MSDKTINEAKVETPEVPKKKTKKSSAKKQAEEIAQLKQDLQDSKEKYLRLFADYDNFRKRTAKERLEYMQTAGKDVILEMLPVIDDFDRAFKSMEDATEVKSVIEGMELIYNKLKNTLGTRGLKAMDVIGETFDAEQHEAITEIPSPDENMKGKIMDVVEKGYRLNDKIIRFPKVVVGK